MVPVGAMAVTWALRRPCAAARAAASSHASTAAARRRAGTRRRSRRCAARTWRREDGERGRAVLGPRLERPQARREPRRRAGGLAADERHDARGQRAAGVAVVRRGPATAGARPRFVIAEPQRPQPRRPLGDPRRRVRRVADQRLHRDRQHADRRREPLDVHPADRVAEREDVDRREVARGVVEEDELGARVRRADRPRDGHGIPPLDRVGELHTGVAAVVGGARGRAQEVARAHLRRPAGRRCADAASTWRRARPRAGTRPAGAPSGSRSGTRRTARARRRAGRGRRRRGRAPAPPRSPCSRRTRARPGGRRRGSPSWPPGACDRRSSPRPRARRGRAGTRRAPPRARRCASVRWTRGAPRSSIPRRCRG